MKYEKGTFVVVPNKDALRGLDSDAQAIYLWICSYADSAGICYPSQETLARDTGLSTRTIIRKIATLCSRGLLEKISRTIEGKKTSNEYQLNLISSDTQSLRSDTQSHGVVTHSHISSDTVSHKLNPYITKSIELNTHGEMGKVKLSTEEYDKLVSQLNQSAVDQLITELDLYIASTGKKYTSHYATIQAWARRRIQEHVTKTRGSKPKSI